MTPTYLDVTRESGAALFARHRTAALADSRLLPLVAPADEWESIS